MATAGAPVMFTCIACHLSFPTSVAQKDHHKTEFHRYNLKRKTVGLPPVNREAFEKLQTVAAPEEPKTQTLECTVCNKKYGSEGGLESHLQSKKHKEKVAEEARNGKKEARPKRGESPSVAQVTSMMETVAIPDGAAGKAEAAAPAPAAPRRAIFYFNHLFDISGDDLTPEEATELVRMKNEVELLDATDCLFCRHKSANVQYNVNHMTREHGFFLPDVEFLVDLPGLLLYLGEKVSVANMCLSCDGVGRAFHSLEAVRGHMVDKGHCKINYDGSEAEFEPFYDFAPSYPVGVEPGQIVAVDDDDTPVFTTDSGELVLPDGKVLGHRSLQRYYKQRPAPADARAAVVIGRVEGMQRLIGGANVAMDREDTMKQNLSRGRREAQLALKYGIRRNNQSHYRPQVMF